MLGAVEMSISPGISSSLYSSIPEPLLKSAFMRKVRGTIDDGAVARSGWSENDNVVYNYRLHECLKVRFQPVQLHRMNNIS